MPTDATATQAAGVPLIAGAFRDPSFLNFHLSARWRLARVVPT
jgi:hypothetical protein